MFEPDRIATERWCRWRPFAFSISARPDSCNFMVRSYSTQAKVNGDWPRAQAALLRTSQTHDLLLRSTQCRHLFLETEIIREFFKPN